MAGDVYVLSTTRFFGGGEIFQIRLAALMRGQLRLVVVSPPVRALESGLAEVGAGFVEIPVQGGVSLRWAMLRWLWRQRSALHSNGAVVVLNGRGAAYLSPFVRLLSGTAPLVIRHTALSMWRWDLKESVYGVAARFARCIVAVSDSLAAQHLQRWPDVEVKSIPNWIGHGDTTRRKADLNLTSAADTLVVAVAARLVRGKGVEDVVAACRGLDGVELHVYGAGPMAAQLRGMGTSNPCVHFHGHVDDVSRQLPRNSVLVSASYSESFSYSVAEGMQAGLLCVVTDIPAHWEMLGGDYPEALFFPPGDLVALRRSLEAARRLMSEADGKGARSVIARAQARIVARNSPELARNRYLTILSAASLEDGAA